MAGAAELVSDAEICENHAFVMAYETLRKEHGHREMNDAALADIVDIADLAGEHANHA